MAEPRLEDELADLAAALAWPDGDGAVDAACRALAAGAGAPLARARPAWRRPALAVAAALLALVLVLPGPRRAVADLMGLGAVSVRVVPSPPAPELVGPPSGARVTIEAAAAGADVELLAPAALGPPDAVWLTGPPGRRIVWLGYRPGPDLAEVDGSGFGLLVTLLPGDVGPMLEKLVGAGRSQRIELDGRPGLWIEGTHDLLTLGEDGDVVVAASRLSASALVVTVGDTTVRLEGELDQATAARLAGTLRPLR